MLAANKIFCKRDLPKTNRDLGEGRNVNTLYMNQGKFGAKAMVQFQLFHLLMNK